MPRKMQITNKLHTKWQSIRCRYRAVAQALGKASPLDRDYKTVLEFPGHFVPFAQPNLFLEPNLPRPQG